MGYFLSFPFEIFGFFVEKSNTMIAMYRREPIKEVENDTPE